MRDQIDDKVQDFLLELVQRLNKHQVKHRDQFAETLARNLYKDLELIKDLPRFLASCRGSWNIVKQESKAGKYVLNACTWTWKKLWRENMQMEQVLTEAEIDPETYVLDGWTLNDILYSNGDHE